MKRILFLIAIVTVFFTSNTSAQEKLDAPTDTFGKTVMQCLKANGIHDQYERATSQMFVMMKQQFVNKNVPNSVWEDLEVVKPIALQDVKIRMVQAYRAHFNDEDINQILSFYLSDEGKKMVADSANLTSDERKVIQDFFHTTTGQKMMESQASLTKMIGEISETWSSELYKAQLDKLADKGFSM